MENLNIDAIRNTTVGTVESISPSEIKVLLDTKAPQNVSINTGTPSLFPRISGFILIPNEVGAVVGMIDWIGIDKQSQKGTDKNILDLPNPRRKMNVIPVGTLKKEVEGDEELYSMERGVYSFPSVGDSVIMPNQDQLASIVKTRHKNAKVNIGQAPLAGNTNIHVDPDKLFGKHLAVLGNTGSGKSCSVAGIIRWSVEAALEELRKKDEDEEQNLNSRFIVLDPNGEYKNAFDDLDKKVKTYKVYLRGEEKDPEVDSFTLPAWMWNSNEWATLTRAQPGTQRPLLFDALRGIRFGRKLEEPFLLRLSRFLNGQKITFQNFLAHPPARMETGDKLDCGRALLFLGGDLNEIYIPNTEQEDLKEVNECLVELRNIVSQIIEKTSGEWDQGPGGLFFDGFSESYLEELINEIENVLDLIELDGNEFETSADNPIQFDVPSLPDFLSSITAMQDQNLTQFINTLSLRIRMLISDERLADVVNPSESISLQKWIRRYLTGIEDDEPKIIVLDLSLIPSDIIHIIIGIFARIIFESLQRYRKEFGEELPTVLALEEAHTFVNSTFSSSQDIQSYNELCLRVFERIAREGRKFGLSLILSSQRPSEISPTVLSQCNSFLLHRIVNDNDQSLVRRLVPDNIGNLLSEIPTLPRQKAILVGLATSIPLLLTIRTLEDTQTPQSDDPHFWDVWTRKEERIVDWENIVNEWQGKDSNNNTGDN